MHVDLITDHGDPRRAGVGIAPVGTVHIERLNGPLCDRKSALTHKLHTFAKRDASLRCTRGRGRSSITTFIRLIG
jgi:hypothetical protein